MGSQSFDGEQRQIELPNGLLGGQSVRTQFNGVSLSFGTTPSPGTPQDSEFKALIAVGVKVPSSRCNPQQGGGDFTMNDAITRCAFWLQAIDANGNTDTDPPPFYIQVRVAGSFAMHSEIRYTGLVTLDAWSDSCLLVQYGGLVGVQYELWAVMNEASGSTARPNLRVIAIFDRDGDIEQETTGEFVTTLP